ncbi:hypothetical protein HGP17_25545 [Rhizobium sp. P38BS-XIX]|uniref:hypothetical protein n=1 Tax=Rhizobium sp. P38BS-XIX TaxID=2726740 RepID=UPI001456BFDC|nr:hypothetical protein [Rhizobium sp. P38BS-XIX]NLS00204.1 hypothetical protein [Rhizobium sp. P38BS-XIX]
MQNYHIRRLVWLVIIVTMVALLPPVIFGEPRKADGTGGDPWRNTIYDFQTLITGLLALTGAGATVFAALATIKQMRDDDHQQDLRHRRQMYLDRRREMIAAKRFLDRITPILVNVNEHASTILNRLEGDAYGYDQLEQEPTRSWSHWERVAYFACLTQFGVLRRMLEATPGTELELLMAQPERMLERLKDGVSGACQYGLVPDDIAMWSDDSTAAPMAYSGQAAVAVAEAIHAAQELKPVLETWYAELEHDFGVEKH